MNGYVKAVLALEAVRRKREARYARVVRRLNCRRDELAAEVATRLRVLSGGQLAAAQRLVAMIAQATASDGAANRGDAIVLGGRLRLIATLLDPAVTRKLFAHLGMVRSRPGPGPPHPSSTPPRPDLLLAGVADAVVPARRGAIRTDPAGPRAG